MNSFSIAGLLVSVHLVGTQALTQRAPDEEAQQPEAPPQVIVVIPVQEQEQPQDQDETPFDENFAGGCWVRFHQGGDDQSAQLTLVGPIDVPDMGARTGMPWREWDSATVGPMARVTTYDAEKFQGRSAILNPRAHITEQNREDAGIVENMASVRVDCGR